MLAEFKNIIKDKNIIYLTIVSSIFWFVYSQLNLSIPLYSKSYLHELLLEKELCGYGKAE